MNSSCFRAGLQTGSRKNKDIPKLHIYWALWESHPRVVTKGFLFCKIRLWLQTLPSRVESSSPGHS